MLRADQRLLWLPAAALIAGIAASSAAIVVSLDDHLALKALWMPLAAVSYVVTTTSVFCNVALLHIVATRWSGGEASLRDGLAFAWRRLPVILAWSLVSSTVSLALQLVQRLGHLAWAERVVAIVLGGSWSVLTFFVVPVLAVEDVGPVAAVRRSAGVVRRRWAESLTGTVTILGAGLAVMIGGMLTFAVGLGVALTTSGVNPIGLLLMVAGAALLLGAVLYAGASSTIFALAVYGFADDGQPRGPFGLDDLQEPFRPDRVTAAARRGLLRVFRRRRD